MEIKPTVYFQIFDNLLTCFNNFNIPIIFTDLARISNQLKNYITVKSSLYGYSTVQSTVYLM